MNIYRRNGESIEQQTSISTQQQIALSFPFALINMGNQQSTVQVASTNPAFNNQYLYAYDNLNAAVLTLESSPSRRTVFRFNNDTSVGGYFIQNITSGDEKLKTGVVDLGRPQQLLIFSRTDPGNGQKRLQCYGTDSTRIISCYNSTVNGQALNKFYSCPTSNNNSPAVQIGVGVPSDCSPLTLTYTPRK